MSQLSDSLYAQARITPIQPQNRVKQVKKLADGSLKVTSQGGQVYTIGRDDELFQAFVVYTVLNTNT